MANKYYIGTKVNYWYNKLHTGTIIEVINNTKPYAYIIKNQDNTKHFILEVEILIVIDKSESEEVVFTIEDLYK